MYVPTPREDGAERAAASHVRASLEACRARNGAGGDGASAWRRRQEAEEDARAAEAEAQAEASAACGLTAAISRRGPRSSTDGGGGGAAAATAGWRRMTRQEKAALVDGVRADGEEAMLDRLQYRLDRAGVSFPGLRVTYDRLTVTRRARAAGHGLPSVVSPLRDAAAALLPACAAASPSPSCRSPASSSSSSPPPSPPAPPTVDVLSDVSGVLRPATTTLLLGAPGAGKTTLLMALSGRLRASGAIVHIGLSEAAAAAAPGVDGGATAAAAAAAAAAASPEGSSALARALSSASPLPPQPPHYWLRYNGAPAAPASTGTGAGAAAAALVACCGGGSAAADLPPPAQRGGASAAAAASSLKKRRPAFEVPAVAAFVDQAELCAPALTVRETLEFAERCQGADAPSLEAVRGMLRWEREHGDLVAAEGPPPAVDAPLDAMLRAVAGVVDGGQENHHDLQQQQQQQPPQQDQQQERYRPHQQLISEWTLRSLRLQHAADTPVGDAMLRGVSGGERRRVALGEALVGPALLFCLDEVTTGLDSASALEVAESLRRSARAFRVTVLCSALQPEPGVVAAFDDLLLLARGRVLYHGPVDGALPHFASLGLSPAPGQEAAEFLAGLAAEDDAEAARLSAAFWAGDAGRALRQEAEWAAAAAAAEAAAAGAAAANAPPPPPPQHEEDAAEAGKGGGGGTGVFSPAGGRSPLSSSPPPPPPASPLLLPASASLLPRRPHAALSQVVRACFRRTYTLEVARNWEAFVVRAGLGLLMAAVMGTLFLRLPENTQGAAAVMGVLVAALDFYAVLSIPTAQTTLSAMPLLLRQRDARYFPAWALLLPQQLVSLAGVLMDVACFALPLYFLVGLTASATALLRYLVVAYCFAACLDAMYRAFGALATSVPVAVSVMTVLFLLFNALAGYTIARRSIPPWWRWLYWINPFAWALRSLAVNELTQPRWQRPVPPEALEALGVAAGGGGPRAPRTVGDSILALYEMPRAAAAAGGGGAGGGGAAEGAAAGEEEAGALGPDGWVWAGAVVLAAEAAFFLLVTWYGYARRRPPVPPVDVAVATAAAAAVKGSAEGRAMPAQAGGGGKAPPQPPALPISVAAADGGGAVSGGRKQDDDDDDDEDEDGMLPPVSVAFRDLCYYVPHPNPAAAVAAAAAEAHAQQQQQQQQQQEGRPPPPRSSRLFSRGGGDTNDAKSAAAPELQLLRGVTGYFLPGRVAALMGASGAGKTTLLDVLAQRKTTGRVTGELAVGGWDPRRDRARFSAVSGYCEQSSDLHVPLATVREAVLFSAALRLRDRRPASPSSSSSSRQRQRGQQQQQRQQRQPRVAAAADAALAVVGLAPQSGVLVQALSLEQKKRLTIAVELAARPSVLFLDEPTSGLDAAGAWAVAARGGTVVCTVHQPGDALFRYAFDDLLLLRRGGAVAFFGPLSSSSSGRGTGGAEAGGALGGSGRSSSCSVLAAYFQGIGGGRRAAAAPEEEDEEEDGAREEGAAASHPAIPPLLAGQNPAAWAITVVGRDAGGGGGGKGAGGGGCYYPDLAKAWRESPQARQASERAGQLLGEAGGGKAESAAPPSSSPSPSPSSRSSRSSPPASFAVGPLAQFRALFARNMRAHWRHPARNLSRLLYALVAAALIGTIYLGKGSLAKAAAAASAAASASAPASSAAAAVSTRDVLNAAGCFFLVVVAMCMESAYAAQEGIALERAPYYRERASGLYSELSYLLAQIAAELPWALVAVLAFVGVSYGLLGLAPTASAFFYFVACGFLGVCAVFLVAQLLVHVSPALFVATLALSVVATAQQALAGLYRTRPTAPAWFAWAYWINPLWYTFAGLVGSQIGGERGIVVADAGGIVIGEGGGGGGGGEAHGGGALAGALPPPTVAEFVRDYFGVDAMGTGLTTPGACLGMLGVLCLGAATLSYAALRTLNFQNR